MFLRIAINKNKRSSNVGFFLSECGLYWKSDKITTIELTEKDDIHTIFGGLVDRIKKECSENFKRRRESLIECMDRVFKV